jgi:hypothetical protein
MEWHIAFETRGGDRLFGRQPFKTLQQAYDVAGDICTAMDKADIPTWGLQFIERDVSGREVRKLCGWQEANHALATLSA